MHKVFCALMAFLFLFAGTAHAMTSTNFTIGWDSINSGGSETGSSEYYSLHDTIGEQAVGSSTSEGYTLLSGYRFGDSAASILSFDIGTQSNSSHSALVTFNNSGKSVTVMDASGFLVGDYIGATENEGAAQIIAIGKVMAVVGNVISVDKWDGNPTSISVSPSGGDDFVYRLSGDAAQLGALSVSAVATSLTHTSVITTEAGGYTVYVKSDGNLRVNDSTFIANVADGAVTINNEEYGAQVYGSTASGTGSDFAFSTSARVIQSSAAVADDDRIGLLYKAAINAGTVPGEYSQVIIYTVTANY